MYSDSHTHLTSHPAEKVPALIKEAESKGVVLLQTWGEDLATSATGLGYAEKNKIVYCGIGIHPWKAVMPAPDVRKRFEELASRRKVDAIGEIGLDWVKNPNNKDVQKAVMQYQVEYALSKKLPVDVHVRGSHDDVMEIIRPAAKAGLKGIAHGFTGDAKELKDWLDLDYYISIGVRGFVTNELPHMVDIVRQTPADRLLSETDNGTFGEYTGLSAVISVVQKIAQVRGSTPDEVGAMTTANLKRIMKLA